MGIDFDVLFNIAQCIFDVFILIAVAAINHQADLNKDAILKLAKLWKGRLL